MLPKTPDKYESEGGKDTQHGSEQVLRRQRMQTVHPEPKKRHHPKKMRPDKTAQTQLHGPIENASCLFGALVRTEKLSQRSEQEEKSERGRTKGEDIRISADKK